MEDDKLSVFTAWAKEQGIKINDGIAPVEIPGKGIGVMAKSELKKGEILLQIPPSALLTLDSPLIRAHASKFPGLSVYGTIAAVLTLTNHPPTPPASPKDGPAIEAGQNPDHPYAPWLATWPSASSLESSMPLHWPAAHRALLPAHAQTLLAAQEAKYNSDLSQLPRDLLPASAHKAYKHYWLLVNTRCFFYTHFRLAVARRRSAIPLPRDQSLALVPYGDLLNHAPASRAGCAVEESAGGILVRAARDHGPHEELTVSYGGHAEDFLAVEYGFVLGGEPGREHDAVSVEAGVLAELREGERELLSEYGYLGDYFVVGGGGGGGGEGLCYRSVVALRSTVTGRPEMRAFLEGTYDGAGEDEAVEEKGRELLGRLAEDARARLAEVEAITEHAYALDMMRTRWRQVVDLLEEAAGHVRV